jgi:hypothetical protein
VQDLLEEILLLQSEWTSKNTPDMKRRGELVRHECASWLRDQLPRLAHLVPESVQDLAVEGRDGTGLKTEVPWVRVHSLARSPSATEGWYVVYLFSALGDRVYLSLIQGTTRWENGEFRPRPPAELAARVAWARKQLGSSLDARPDLVQEIVLDSRKSDLGRGYEQGTVAAFAYPIDAIPQPAMLAHDLDFLVQALGVLHQAEDSALDLPGEPAPEVSDALVAVERAAGRRIRGRGYRLTAPEKKAIELRAMRLAVEFLTKEGYSAKDVGATHSYDVHASRDGVTLYVEVKGTTSPGVEVILTKNEVELHLREHPNTMLIVASDIVLNRTSDPPTANGGVLRVVHPWLISPTSLDPLAYRYTLDD